DRCPVFRKADDAAAQASTTAVAQSRLLVSSPRGWTSGALFSRPPAHLSRRVHGCGWSGRLRTPHRNGAAGDLQARPAQRAPAVQADVAMPGKRVQIDNETWQALDLLARDRSGTFQELADEAFADLLKKHGRPVDLKTALRKSAGVSAEVVRLADSKKARQ